jgi:fatty-acyl-CoA synthase
MLETLPDYLDHHARSIPGQDAIVDGDRRIAWEGLREFVDDLARGLLGEAVRRGDRVAAWLPPSVEAYALFLACSRVGAIFVGLNPKSRLPEVRQLLDVSAPKLLVAAASTSRREYGEELAAIAEEWPSLHIVPVDLVSRGGAGLDRLAARGQAVPVAHLLEARRQVRPSDPATIVFTSGSTGSPKGALLTQRGFTHTYWHAYRERAMPSFRAPAYFAINHIAGLGDIGALTFVAGGTLFPMEQFEPDALLALVERERLTYLPGVATHFHLIFSKCDLTRWDLTSLEYVWWGGAGVTSAMLARFYSLAPRVSTDFGQTETTGPLIFTPADAAPEDKTGTIGRPSAALPVRLADADGNLAEAGEPGEIQTSGPAASPGYFDRPDDSAALYTSDGWLRTGDLAVERPDGYYVMVGRMKEMFKSGGYNVYPVEIEEAIGQYPEVQLSAVVAVQDELFQEVGFAWIVAEDPARFDLDALRAFLSDRMMNYKIPKHFAVREDLPRTPIGKIDRLTLSADARARLKVE